MTKNHAPNRYDLVKITISLLVIAAFIYLTVKIVEPFLLGFFWAVMVVVTTWPLMIAIQKRLFYKRYLAVMIMLLVIGSFFVIPTTLIALNITKNSSYLIELAKNISHNGLPQFDFLLQIPYIGSDLHAYWIEFSQGSVSDLLAQFQHYLTLSLPWILEQIVNIGTFIFHCCIMLILSAFLYLKGEMISQYLYFFAHKISSQYGVQMISLTGRSIRAVALGIILTAAVLAILGGSSLALTHVPFPGIITVVIFICCVVQIGPVIVIIGGIIWQFYHGHTTYAIILIICALILTTLDSVMRTLLIKKGVDLPFFLILFGVVGGMFAFGVMGLFIGPTVLALVHNFMRAWIKPDQSN